tara:strand:+ start:197 stop:826 length:630 start_codon:yes stop_codon:yes gene_type:complete
MSNSQFLHDRDNRIQKLYYDVKFNTIYNRTKLQNIKNKFWKYLGHLMKYSDHIILQIELLQMESEKNHSIISQYITSETKYNELMRLISERLISITTHQNIIRDHYKKCSHCEKTDIVTISGCKFKHKICADCIHDKTKCPVCKEDLGLVHCDICYEYKKELVDTGCENKHQTCNECLQQIKKRVDPHNRCGSDVYKCPFCRDTIINHV